MTITEEECRQMREEGFTFADGIREIKEMLARIYDRLDAKADK